MFNDQGPMMRKRMLPGMAVISLVLMPPNGFAQTTPSLPCDTASWTATQNAAVAGAKASYNRATQLRSSPANVFKQSCLNIGSSFGNINLTAIQNMSSSGISDGALDAIASSVEKAASSFLINTICSAAESAWQNAIGQTIGLSTFTNSASQSTPPCLNSGSLSMGSNPTSNPSSSAAGTSCANSATTAAAAAAAAALAALSGGTTTTGTGTTTTTTTTPTPIITTAPQPITGNTNPTNNSTTNNLYNQLFGGGQK